MPRKPTVSRKDAFFAQQQNSGKKSHRDSESEDSGFESDDIASDYEDQLEQNRDLKRRKRDENQRNEERKIISGAYLPTSTKKLAACIHCRLVLNKEKWRRLERCPNCPKSAGLLDTTEQFSNLMGSVLPKVSWVAQWQGMREQIPGFYAMAIE